MSLMLASSKCLHLVRTRNLKSEAPTVQHVGNRIYRPYTQGRTSVSIHMIRSVAGISDLQGSTMPNYSGSGKQLVDDEQPHRHIRPKRSIRKHQVLKITRPKFDSNELLQTPSFPFTSIHKEHCPRLQFVRCE